MSSRACRRSRDRTEVSADPRIQIVNALSGEDVDAKGPRDGVPSFDVTLQGRERIAGLAPTNGAGRWLPSWRQAGHDSLLQASRGCSRRVSPPSYATGTACARYPGYWRHP